MGWSARWTPAPGEDIVLLQLIACPEPSCRVPAEVSDRFALSSTSGPIEYIRTYCLRRHIFTVPAERVVVLETAPR
jgi:hypothetical protein